MLGKIFSVMCLISLFFAIICGNTAELGGAVLAGASQAVSLTISLLGMMCLWSGVMRVLQAAGAAARLSRMISPLLRFLFPCAYRSGRGLEEISAAISANLLGIGNAATPLALKAMEALEADNDQPGTATDDMITFTLMNLSPLNLIPATLIALRHAAGSAKPHAVIIPVWISSGACFAFAMFAARIGRRRGKGREVNKKARADSDGKSSPRKFSTQHNIRNK